MCAHVHVFVHMCACARVCVHMCVCVCVSRPATAAFSSSVLYLSLPATACCGCLQEVSTLRIFFENLLNVVAVNLNTPNLSYWFR